MVSGAQADPAALVTYKPQIKGFLEIKWLQLLFFCGTLRLGVSVVHKTLKGHKNFHSSVPLSPCAGQAGIGPSCLPCQERRWLLPHEGCSSEGKMAQAPSCPPAVGPCRSGPVRRRLPAAAAAPRGGTPHLGPSAYNSQHAARGVGGRSPPPPCARIGRCLFESANGDGAVPDSANGDARPGQGGAEDG